MLTIALQQFFKFETINEEYVRSMHVIVHRAIGSTNIKQNMLKRLTVALHTKQKALDM